MEEEQPVILGAGLTGLVISHVLSAAGVRHTLVGDRPNGEPRLGESLNAEGSLELRERFASYARFFHEKNRMAMFYGANAFALDFDAEGPTWPWDGAYGFPSAIALFHVDRIGLDAALFDAAVASEFCRHVEGRVTALAYHRGLDRITALELASGDVLCPTYVFDASNQSRVVAKNIGLHCELVGPRQRVVFAHYRRRSEAGSAAPWADATSLVRLHRPLDLLEGLGWCIPLGDYVSVGLNVEAEQVLTRDASLLLRLEEAFAARGVDVCRFFPERGDATRVAYQHYVHERAYGRNWMLAGPSFCQAWFPSGAGVGTSLVAAQFAVEALCDPMGAGSKYEAYMRQIVSMHGQLDWLATDDPNGVSAEDLGGRATAMVRGNAKRLAWYVAMRGEAGDWAMRKACAQVYESDRTWATRCRVIAGEASEQARWAFVRRGVIRCLD